MPTTGIEPLWDAAQIKAPYFSKQDLKAWPEELVRTLRAMRVLIEKCSTEYVTCSACGELHQERVIRFDHEGKTQWYIPCPFNGRVEVSEDELVQFTFDFAPLAGWAARELRAKGQLEEQKPGEFWRLGRVALAGKSRDAWCLRIHTGTDWQTLPPLPKSPGSVFLTLGPQAELLSACSLPADQVVALEEVVHLTPEGLHLDIPEIESRVRESSRPSVVAANVGKRRERRLKVVEKLKKALHEHILAARSHAQAALDQGDLPELLPLPKQKELARLIGESESAVSRAITKAKDKHFKVLLDVVENLDDVLKYSARAP